MSTEFEKALSDIEDYMQHLRVIKTGRGYHSLARLLKENHTKAGLEKTAKNINSLIVRMSSDSLERLEYLMKVIKLAQHKSTEKAANDQNVGEDK